MESASPGKSPKGKNGDALVSVMDTGPSLGLKTKFLKVPLFIYFIAIFVLIGGYAILRSHADAIIQTQVWNTTAGWRTGTFNNAVASNNAVTLATTHYTQRVGRVRKTITGYNSSGSITLDFNAGAKVNWNSLTPSSITPKYTSISYEERTSANNSTWSAWTSTLSSATASQYIQIKASLSTTSSSVTPSLNALTLVYASTAPAPTVSLTANSTTVTSGQPATLTWTSANATSCTASGAWSGSEATSGSVSTGNLSATSTYNISCTAVGQTAATASVTITVTAPPPPTTTGSSSSSGCTYNATVAPCVGSATTGASGWGTPVFDDEFSGSSINTSLWSTNNGWTNQNNVTSYASNVTETGGDLILTLASSTSGAEVETANFTLPVGGFAEARIDFPGSGTTIYNWPAWWTAGPGWPASGEHDIFEGLGSATVNYHYALNGNNTQAGPFYIPGTWSNAFHTYGLYRGSNYADVYYDGTLVKTYPTDDNGQPEQLILTVGAANIAAYGSASQVKVDYVRAWE